MRWYTVFPGGNNVNHKFVPDPDLKINHKLGYLKLKFILLALPLGP